MTARRFLWAALSPIVWLVHRAELCSYKWVNVCHGARHPERFTALWQHHWYGEPIPALPPELALCGCPYTTAVSQGLVTFVDEFSRSRIAFERDPHDPFATMWAVSLYTSFVIPAAHVQQAYEWVCAVFGDSFEARQTAIGASFGRGQ